MTTTTHSRSGRRAALPAALALLALFLCRPAPAAAQWSQPDNAGNTSTTGAGNVGVGTSTPAEKLQVAGSIVTTGSSTYAGSQLIISNNDAIGPWIASHTDAQGRSTANFAATRINIQAGGLYYQFSPATGIGTTRTWTTGMFLDPSSRNVGVGTASPASRLHLVSETDSATSLLRLDTGTHGGSAFTVGANAGNESSLDLSVYRGGSYYSRLLVAGDGSVSLQPSGGNVGIGTASPTARLHIISADDTVAPALSVRQDSNPLFGFDVTLDTNVNGNLTFNRVNNGASAAVMTFDRAGGNVGIGTAPSSYRLDVGGAANVGGDLNVTGNITGANIQATYQDVAEWVPSVQKLQAGTVVVLDGARTNHVLASSSAYDTKVAGVVSAEPGVILGTGGEGKLKVATTGRVRVKVDASRGAIKVGDLLVTSGAEGVAMKSIPVDLGGTPIHRPGTIIGKALEPLESGTGEILVLLSLQ